MPGMWCRVLVGRKYVPMNYGDQCKAVIKKACDGWSLKKTERLVRRLRARSRAAIYLSMMSAHKQSQNKAAIQAERLSADRYVQMRRARAKLASAQKMSGTKKLCKKGGAAASGASSSAGPMVAPGATKARGTKRRAAAGGGGGAAAAAPPKRNRKRWAAAAIAPGPVTALPKAAQKRDDGFSVINGLAPAIYAAHQPAHRATRQANTAGAQLTKILVHSPLFANLQGVFADADGGLLNVGLDRCLGNGGVAMLCLCRAWAFTPDAAAKEIFEANAHRMKLARPPIPSPHPVPPSMTLASRYGFLADQLVDAVATNTAVTGHGIKKPAQSLPSILESGCDEAYCSLHAYGFGFYSAPQVEKADQYAEKVLTVFGRDRRLFDVLYDQGYTEEPNLSYMLIVKTLAGCFESTAGASVGGSCLSAYDGAYVFPHAHGRGASCVGDRRLRPGFDSLIVDSPPPRLKELVIVRSAQAVVMPLYLCAYVRLDQNGGVV